MVVAIILIGKEGKLKKSNFIGTKSRKIVIIFLKLPNKMQAIKQISVDLPIIVLLLL